MAFWNNLAFSTKLECFFQIFTSSNKGSNQTDSVKNKARNAKFHIFWWKTNSCNSAACSYRVNCRVKSSLAYSGYNSAMSAAYLLHSKFRNIFLKWVHAQICAIFLSKFKLSIVNIYCDYVRTKYVLCILQRKITKTAKTE